MKSVGIDIGTYSIKVVEVISQNKGQLRVSQFLEHSLGQNPAFDPEIEIIEFLKGLAKAYDPSNTRFVFGLRQDQVSVRHKIFPFNDRLKINKSLPFELEEDLPFSAETAIFDAKIIRTSGPSSEVLACASPKHRITEFLKRFGDIGFDISILSAEGVALSNTFEDWNQPPPHSTQMVLQLDPENAPLRKLNLLISIGHGRTIVNAIENNRLVGVRAVFWGVKQVAEAIARRYEIPYIEALKEMQTKSFILPSKDSASYDQIVFSDTIANQFKELSRELKITILEMNSELLGTVESVEITGGGSQVLNLEAFLTQMLELPVNKKNILDSFTNLGFEKSARIDVVAGIALGLAIEGVKKPRNPALQFLRSEFAKQNHLLKKFWENWGLTLQFAVAIYITFFVYSILRESFSQSLADRTVEALKTQAKTVAKLPTKQANESGIKKYIKEQKQRASELRTLTHLTQMNSALDIMKKISDATPAKNAITLNVKRLNIEENKVSIEGTVAQKIELDLLHKTLSQLSQNGQVETKSSQIPSPPGSVAFAYSFKIDRGVSNGP